MNNTASSHRKADELTDMTVVDVLGYEPQPTPPRTIEVVEAELIEAARTAMRLPAYLTNRTDPLHAKMDALLTEREGMLGA